jgi:hypothetical protein
MPLTCLPLACPPLAHLPLQVVASCTIQLLPSWRWQGIAAQAAPPPPLVLQVCVGVLLPASPGLAGLAITSALNLTGIMNWMVRAPACPLLPALLALLLSTLAATAKQQPWQVSCVLSGRHLSSRTQAAVPLQPPVCPVRWVQVRQTTELEVNMNSVERMVEYLKAGPPHSCSCYLQLCWCWSQRGTNIPSTPSLATMQSNQSVAC